MNNSNVESSKYDMREEAEEEIRPAFVTCLILSLPPKKKKHKQKLKTIL